MDVETKTRAERIKEIAEEIVNLWAGHSTRVAQLETLVADALNEIAIELEILRERGR